MFSNEALKRLIIPLVIEQTLAMLVGIIDTIMVSCVGEAAISGVALVDMVNYLIMVVLAAVATGGAVIVSQYLGSRRYEKASMSASQLITISFVVSTLIMLVCLLMHSYIIKILFGSIAADVELVSNTYFFITALSFPFLGVYNSAAAIYRSMGKTNVTMYVAIFENILNVCGNVLGIFLFKVGVAGVAVSTLVSRMAAAIIMLCFAMNKRNIVYIKVRKVLKFDKLIVGKILKIAVPNGIENGLFALGRVLVTSIVALFGTSQIAANGVANSVDQISIIVVNAINLAIITVVGQCMGAGEIEQAEIYTKKLMKISYIFTGLLGVMVCAMLPLILGLYQLEEDTRSLSIILIIIHNTLAFLLHPTSFNLANSLRASGDVKITMLVGIGSMLIFRLGVAYILAIVCGLGVIGVWIAMGSDWVARSTAFTVRYKSGSWKNIKVI